MNAQTTLRDVRFVLKSRSGAPPTDVSYSVYAGAMLLAVVGFPLVRTLGLWVAQPHVLAILGSSGAAMAQGSLGILLAVFVVLGGIRGPALLTPFMTAAVAGNGLPRRQTLRRPLLVAALMLSVGGAAAPLLVGLVLASAGAASLGSVVVGVVGGALAGVTCCGFWLLGQRLSETPRFVLSVAIVAATAFSPQLPVLALAGLALVVCATAPSLLNGLSGPDLLRQARRWDTAGTLAFTGDLSMAFGEFRSVPRHGRNLPAIGAGQLALVFVRRDLVGSLRTPARCVSACVGSAGGGFLVALALASPADVAWLAAGAGALIGFLALGVWSDGFRHSVESASAPTLYGVSPATLFALHAVFPLLAGAACASLGAIVAVAVGAPLLGLVTAIACSVVLVALRLYDAAKGPLPLTVLAPVPSPVGDLSSIVIMAWQADALLLAVAVGVVVTAAAGLGAGGLLIAIPILLAIMLRARGRVAAL